MSLYEFGDCFSIAEKNEILVDGFAENLYTVLGKTDIFILLLLFYEKSFCILVVPSISLKMLIMEFFYFLGKV